MKLKWYLSALVIALTLLGVGQHQISVPNQEIVLQFSDEVSSDIAKETLLIVQSQLQSIGAEKIHTQEVDGGLRITYYSSADVTVIKQLLSNKNLELGYTSSASSQEPLKENTKRFDLDVFEIQKTNNFDLDLDGIVLDQKPENPRYLNSNFYISFEEIDIKERHSDLKRKYIIQRDIALAIKNTSHKIPEVRAGPEA